MRNIHRETSLNGPSRFDLVFSPCAVHSCLHEMAAERGSTSFFYHLCSLRQNTCPWSFNCLWHVYLLFKTFQIVSVLGGIVKAVDFHS